jgi:hypothetical protein
MLIAYGAACDNGLPTVSAGQSALGSGFFLGSQIGFNLGLLTGTLAPGWWRFFVEQPQEVAA